MISTPELPGLRFQTIGEQPAPSPLRSDVAGFIGRTRRGPVGHAVRVQGLRDYESLFGGLDRDKPFPYSIRGYFENGGQIAHVVRVAPDDVRYACVTWVIGTQDEEGKWDQDFPTAGRFRAAKYLIHASSPGSWAAGLQVTINYDVNGPGGKPTLSLTIVCPGERSERIDGLHPGETQPGKTLEDQIASRSQLIRIEPRGEAKDSLTDSKGRPLVDEKGVIRLDADGNQRIPLPVPPGPLSRVWDLTLSLSDSDGKKPLPEEDVASQYNRAIVSLGDQTEVALLATPSIYHDITDPIALQWVLQTIVRDASEKQDRFVLIDPPPPHGESGVESMASGELLDYVNQLRAIIPNPIHRRAAAVYHPWLRVNDPLGDAAEPQKTIPPSGHVAGVMSRVDRERGAHYTPANVSVLAAVDVETQLERNAGGPLNEAGVNLIRCVPGKGLMVWGGRTLDLSRQGRFVAHRRFIHRLIRAIRRVAEPVVFDINGPELWLILVRALSSVLLEAFRGGALHGDRPEEAFCVRCDDQTSPMTERELGRVFCEIDLALTAPMEFITIRVSVSRQGQVEVYDA
ncbi:phage tail sheath family protein [Stieleria varia]|uniref:Phage tail sheath protein n=1 Tax=Stieleria varia TaxID=2528005 RepID=A0A5C5ZXM5_9BACT|nr:phage tail sheath subtilisin-like domain-containing protein [Stieleria varia]TWT91737.1 Phage tail sheath protein [Stieleria varia]